MQKKHISIITACYNEEENVENLIAAVAAIFQNLPQYTYEHVFIDNSSQDKTVEILKNIAQTNPKIKAIVNVRNFGHIRSPFHGMIQCTGDAVISLVADFQDPPQMIPKFLEKWEEGYKIVIGVKKKSKESPIMFALRGFFTIYFKNFHQQRQTD